jgi:hypothetical protein
VWGGEVTDWQWTAHGIYDGDVPIIWPAQDSLGNLYVGVMADFEDVILAAPGLLAACENMIKEYTDHCRIEYARPWMQQALDQIQAAIAKAKGETP